MAHASPASKKSVSSPPRSSPEHRFVSSFLSEDRNSELSHRDALEQARLEHERVRLNAIRISELYELQEEKQRIAEAQRREQDLLKVEAAVREEQERLRELQARKVPELPPQPDPPKPKEPEPEPAPKAQPAQQLKVNGTTEATPAERRASVKEESSAPSLPKVTPGPTSPFAASQAPAASAKTLSPSPFAQPQQSSPKPPAPTQQVNGLTPAAAPGQPSLAPPSSQPPAPSATTPPAADGYVQIHQQLKKLRQDIARQMKIPGSPLKQRLGDLRRTVRKAIGQLTAGKGANAKPINAIVSSLKESLDGSVPSDLVDASLFVRDKREPVEGAAYNGDQLPSAFIFLLNHLSKAVIQQFTNETGTQSKSAEPIGIVVAHVFSNPDFHWRGRTMIDVLTCKFRVACPVLFGARGSEKTEAGRAALGWKREDGRWVSDQAHADRMTGLGAGFAAISLRDFSKASKKNPFPPSNYWSAVARIVNTPPDQVSDTQFTVLKAMVDGHESRFIQFYGNAAVAALRMALVEFPRKAPPNSHNAQALQVLGQVLQRDSGLVLG